MNPENSELRSRQIAMIARAKPLARRRSYMSRAAGPFLVCAIAFAAQGQASAEPFYEIYLDAFAIANNGFGEDRYDSTLDPEGAIAGEQRIDATASDGFVSAEARARADFSEGKIGILAYGSYDFVDGYGQAQAFARMRDRIIFDVDDIGEDGLAVTLNFRIDGAVSVPPEYSDLPESSRPNGGVNAVITLFDFYSQFASYSTGFSQQGEYEIRPENMVGDVISFDLLVFQAAPMIDFEMVLNASVNGAEADYFGTAALDIVLPQGVTYTSASGVLLAGSPALVPEPAALGLLGLGLTGLVLVRRRPK